MLCRISSSCNEEENADLEVALAMRCIALALQYIALAVLCIALAMQ